MNTSVDIAKSPRPASCLIFDEQDAPATPPSERVKFGHKPYWLVVSREETSDSQGYESSLEQYCGKHGNFHSSLAKASLFTTEEKAVEACLEVVQDERRRYRQFTFDRVSRTKWREVVRHPLDPYSLDEEEQQEVQTFTYFVCKKILAVNEELLRKEGRIDITPNGEQQ